MDNSQRQIFEQQIQLFQIQIQQQNKRQQKLKNLINTLTQQIQYQKDLQKQNFQLNQLNTKLLNGLKQLKSKNTSNMQYYDNQITKLKQQIHQKINQCQRQRIQYKKKQLIYQQKINLLQSIIQKKSTKITELQNKIHNDSILKLKQPPTQKSKLYQKPTKYPDRSLDYQGQTLRISNISNYQDTQNNMKISNLSNMSTLSKKNKQLDYIKLNKPQIKIMMGALIKSKRQLENADTQIFYHNQSRQNKSLFQ